jgi:hypothetical protein
MIDTIVAWRAVASARESVSGALPAVEADADGKSRLAGSVEAWAPEGEWPEVDVGVAPEVPHAPTAITTAVSSESGRAKRRVIRL